MTTTATRTLTLTQIRVNGRNPQAHRDLTDPTGLHWRINRLVHAPAPSPSHRADHQLLYRIERTPAGTTLLVQSPHPIDTTTLPDGYADDIQTRDISPLLDWATAGRTVRFRIDATPTATVRNHDQLLAEGERRATAAIKRGATWEEATAIRTSLSERAVATRRGIRLPLTGQDATDWWHQRAARAGLACHLIETSPLPTIRADRSHKTNSPCPDSVHHALRYEGIATITDPEPLRAAITDGIGHGRIYGLGLLSIAPHHD